ncbi:MAG: SpoIID/LytB domain-containing protein [bacterium]|nr:SpoIID/LytB domain-containing protein [bacterium]
MNEPKVRNITAPNSEPELRIGIVLAEDQKKSLQLNLIDSSYSLNFESKDLVLNPGDGITVAISNNKISIRNSQKVISENLERLFLSPINPQSLRKNSGINFNSLVAGRGFHWQKEINAIFSGAFEISIQNESLIVVNIINLEDYLVSVISSEMSSICPVEFGKAQAVAARSWVSVFLGNKHQGLPFTICNDDCCQRYQGNQNLSDTVIEAIKACRGEYLINPKNFICPAYYSKSCGGQTDTTENIFGFEACGISPIVDGEFLEFSSLTTDKKFLPWINSPSQAFCSDLSVKIEDLKKYLGNVDTEDQYFRWRYKIDSETMLKNLSQKFDITNSKSVFELRAGKRGLSGRYLSFDVDYKDINSKISTLHLKNQYDIRRFFHDSFLFSSAFEFKTFINKSGDLTSIEFFGSGWGHGIGLCQIGALGMSLRGFQYKKILNHYYPECKIVKFF